MNNKERDFTKKYQCRKCGELLGAYEVFESGWPDHIQHWCLNHIPLRSRFRLWRQEPEWPRWVPWRSK